MSKIRMSGLASGLDTESIIKELMSAQRMKSTKIQNKITKLEWKQDRWKEVNSKIYSLYTGPLTKMKMQGAYNTNKATSSNEAKATATAGIQTPEGTHTVEVTSVASAQYITGKELNLTKAATNSTLLYTSDGTGLAMSDAGGKTIKITVGDKTPPTTVSLEIKKDVTTIGDFVDALKSAGLNASFDTTRQRFFISAKASGTTNAFTIESDGTAVEFGKLGLSEITKTVNADKTVTIGVDPAVVTKVNPADAIIKYNGATITSASNNIAVNGLNINVKDRTAVNEVINITVSKDTQAIYDSVKSFVKSYNEVLKALYENYDADLAKGYEPLTDDEKESMSDDQIEKWENKIKNSLLRRDENLNSVISGMRQISEQGVKVNGKNYSLASFGITSVVYTEKGSLHIDGDKDDTLTSAKTDKLMKEITENPDAVMEVFTTLVGKLYTTMTDQMKSTSLRSALTVYNDKDMKKQITTYKEDLDKLEDKLEDIESRYYKQFTAMEKAMSNMNAQQSSISSLLGTSNQ